MTESEAALLTYEQAGAKFGRGPRWIRERVKAGELIAEELGYNTKRISELAIMKFRENRRTVEKQKR